MKTEVFLTYGKKVKRGSWSFEQKQNLRENLFFVILAFYPLRHISWGLDFWDTGYNYANFQYMGTRHMDPMWLFSTYLANVTGNLLTKLPSADTLMGMNLYTGLFASVLALTGYFFCTRKLKMQTGIVFAGEMIALSLCWCPTALLYNYLTYLFFLLSSILLYIGLTKEKRACMIWAGVFLGTNVLVRFSNLPEAAMIVAVWAYDFIVWLEERKGGAGKKDKADGKDRAEKDGRAAGRDEAERNDRAAEKDRAERNDREAGKDEAERNDREAGQDRAERKDRAEKNGEEKKTDTGFWKRTLRHTLWCLLGYAAALAVLLNYIHIRYGIDAYITGIRRLFSMTGNASDYKAISMIRGILDRYVENLYWAGRLGVIVAGGMVLFALAGRLEDIFSRGKAQEAGGAAGGKVVKEDTAGGNVTRGNAAGRDITREDASGGNASGGMVWAVHVGIRLLWAGVSVLTLWWLYAREFCSLYFYSYDPIYRPGTIFLMLTMFIAVVRIFHPQSPREEKLLGGMLILIILLTSIGSNNGVYPSMNNLFLAAPYTLWESWRFIRHIGERRMKNGWRISAFPAKGILVAFLALCLFQFGGFGMGFAFAEATGIQDANTVVTNNEILKNIKMSPEKARWMEEISAYVKESGLQGKEVILYGDIPSLSYYLQMPSAFNPWSDLDSYSLEVMESELAQIEGQVKEKGMERPVIILENYHALAVEGGLEALEASDISEKKLQEMKEDQKWKRLTSFMDTLGYEQSFRNEKFAVYR